MAKAIGHVDVNEWVENAEFGVDKKGKVTRSRRLPPVDTTPINGISPRLSWDIRAEKPFRYNSEESVVLAYRPEVTGWEWYVCRFTSDGWAYGGKFHASEDAARTYFAGWNGWID